MQGLNLPPAPGFLPCSTDCLDTETHELLNEALQLRLSPDRLQELSRNLPETDADAFAQQLVTTNPDLDTLEIDEEEHDFEE